MIGLRAKSPLPNSSYDSNPNPRMLVVGLGTQGQKRILSAGSDFAGSVDPFNRRAEFESISEVPLDEYDGAFICTPDEDKIPIIEYLLKLDKHVMCEKPLKFVSSTEIERFSRVYEAHQGVYYTAYNHRFEPSFKAMKSLLNSGELGEIYTVRFFYGNGTARLVRTSPWRDKGDGVLSDLGSHLLDTTLFFLDNWKVDFQPIFFNSYENKSPDHVIISSKSKSPFIEIEMSLCMWKNTFTCDVLAERGSAHIVGLCKWGVSHFIHRKRIFPAGIPEEVVTTYPKGDPTWDEEYAFFKNLVQDNLKPDLKRDFYISEQLQRLNSEMKIG